MKIESLVREVVFIDQGVEDHETLVYNLRKGIKIHFLNHQQDGVVQLTNVLKQYSNLNAIHIVSHGHSGCLILGNSQLTSETLGRYQKLLFSWQQALNNNADILLYGCEVGKGEAGEAFIQQLAAHTHANIAASTNLTGNKQLNGDWELGYRVGSVSAQFPFNACIIESYPAVLPTVESFTGFVHSTNRAPSFTFNGFTYAINDPSPQPSDLREMVSGGDPLLELGGGLGTTIFSIARTDGSEFSLSSLTIRDQFFLGDTYSVSGWRDGVKVTANRNHTLTGSNANTNTFSGASDIGFQNIDRIEFAGNDIGFSLEDWTFGTAVGSPTITSATYNAATNSLVVTGTNLTATAGALNDINVAKLTLNGQGSTSYTLTSSNVEIDSATQFTVGLNTNDQINVEGLLNKNGTSAVDATTFNIAAADDWNPSQAGNADLTGNAVTVSNVQTPTITSATYNASTGSLVITGTNLVKANGATNDITANKFTLNGEGGATYTLTDTSNVEITSGSAFTLTLSATDRAAVNQILNKNGTTSTDVSTYNLAAADDWNTVIGNTDISDLFGNGITVSNVAAPTITSAAYDASTGALVVTGTGFLSSNGAANDIIANKFTLTGEGGATYTLTNSANVEITSGTAFTLTLSATDRAAVNQVMNKNGTISTDISTYNLAAAEDWAAGADAAVVVADLTGNGVTVSNVAVPTITSATYDASTGALIVTGTGFLSSNGAANDIIANKFTLTGEGGATYTLTDSANVEITSGTAFKLTLSATDRSAVNQILNKNGTISTDISTYNLAAAEDWAAGADAAVNIVDATGNGITVSNVAVPTITSAAYDASTGALVVTGTDFLSSSGTANDIIANKFTLTGEGGATYTLTDSADVEITSGTAFTLTLSATDRAAVNQILNKNGTTSTDISTYNLAAAEDWAAGADASVNIVDASGNGITVSNVAVPTITSAVYDSITGALIVTGAGFLSSNGAANDIIANKFTLTGEGGATYTLT
nr:DUF4347 domain-containing protein [Nitrosomonas sp.]